jgi:exopolyphosphatase/guanosine-5'-triphosphate,3'-diphosphate pyrophosphatase
LGVIRLTERFVHTDPLSGRDERKMVRHIDEELSKTLKDIRTTGYDRVIGTSGTILSLGTVASSDRRRSTDEIRNLRIPAKHIHRLRKEVTGRSISDRMKLPGLDPRRADLIVAGGVLLDEVLRKLDAADITLCDLALREGLILDYIHRNRKHIAQAGQYPDIRRRSVVELAERCSYWPEHAHQVARLALSVFDQTRGVHGLTDREREWLEFAALLHDIGTHISYPGHHKHSYYLIKNGDLRGFEPTETEVIALVARYHRKSTPKKSHPDFGSLKPKGRKAVRSLSAILRFVENLDRSHAQVVSAIELNDRGDEYLIKLRSAGDAELELWAAHRQIEPLQDMLGKPVRLSAGRTSYAEQPEQSTRVSGQAVRGRRHRRIGKDHAAAAAGKVADRRRSPSVRHGMELVGARQSGDKNGKEKKLPDAHDLQPVTRH